MKKLFVSLLAMLFIASCSQDDVPPPSPEQNPQEQRGLEGARLRLAKIVTNPVFRNQLVAKDNPMGLAVVTETTMLDRYGDPLTRAEEDSAQIYVFEFENGGFAVLGEAPHLPELLAFSPGSSGDFAPLIPDTASVTIGGDHSNDPIVFGDPTRNYLYSQAEYSFYNGYEPLIYTWHQEDPFNQYCNGNMVGCVPVAVAMVMMHPSGQPYSYGGLVFDWEEMQKWYNPKFTGPQSSFTGANHIYRLLAMVGRPENLNASYGTAATGARLEDAPRTFRNFGYSNGGKVENYTFEKVKAEISTNHPVICRAQTSQNNSTGHAWVISAIAEERIPWTECDPQTGLVVRSGYEVFYLVHCNWGWGNKKERNGFYIQDYFNTNKGPKVGYDLIRLPYSPLQGYPDYKYERRILTGIRK